MLKVCLSMNGGEGFVATVETQDDDELWLPLSDDHEGDAAGACQEAARLLREAAARFDLLAAEQKPVHVKTHARVNAARVSV